jgi:hypothetical protein
MFDDERIDEAARTLTQGEPRPGFRTRVLDRLDRRPARSRKWVAVPAAAAAIAILALMLTRESAGPVGRFARPPDATEAPAPPEVAVADRPAVGTSPSESAEPAEKPPRRRSPRVTAVSERVVLPLAVAPTLESDLTLPAIVVAAVTVPADVIEPLVENETLAIDALSIAPLAPFDSAQ